MTVCINRGFTHGVSTLDRSEILVLQQTLARRSVLKMLASWAAAQACMVQSVKPMTQPIKVKLHMHFQVRACSCIDCPLNILLNVFVNPAAMSNPMQVHSHLVEWSQDLHQLKSVMDTLEEEDRLLDQAYISPSHQSHGSNGTQSNSTANDGKNFRDLTAHVAHHTENALSASSQAPQDGMQLLEGIANLSKQMVGEAQEDVELFDRASKSVGGQGT